MKRLSRRTPVFLDSSPWKWVLQFLIYIAFSFFLTGFVLISLEEKDAQVNPSNHLPNTASYVILIVYLIFMITMSGSDALMNIDHSRLEKQTWFYRSLPISPVRLILSKAMEYLFHLGISGFIFGLISYSIILKEYPTFSFLHYFNFLLAIVGYALVYSGWLLYYRLAMKHRVMGIYLWYLFYLGTPILFSSIFIRENLITYLLREVTNGNVLVGIGLLLSGFFIFTFWVIYTHHSLTKRDLTLS